MKMHTHPKATITLGEFIMHVYDACTAPKAEVLVRLALKTQQVMWRGNPPPAGQHHHSILSPGRTVHPKSVRAQYHGSRHHQPPTP